MKHPNIVRFIGTSICPPYMCILSEFCQNGSLHDVLMNNEVTITYKQELQMALDCARGLDVLHSQSIIHRDIKSLNFLVDSQWNVKLTGTCESSLKFH